MTFHCNSNKLSITEGSRLLIQFERTRSIVGTTVSTTQLLISEISGAVLYSDMCVAGRPAGTAPRPCVLNFWE